ncbi:rRNA maturation RNase YbeY [candidate division WOR-1 bacterium RIFOXYA2_FULL_36_21]|uniref:Endoribonuclease YbeY n=1 Tax=candidate division WOR-1 bacterium RIFOXYB2_FULL_36_35 TaxID=1802578 RepID=A0A1F4S032_UNCSA|nr:MAG: rRNA maturation RNase YbeY [candidate division WOR-1 bacterium RIFOXYA2_FULL_36_21]OGC13759.1 MAG: rRNA maturation RNase YbeY [candidate division WOR-1 bacterium RIFOXYB2_FULL_36_35]OGC14482.1 MAG: rRNA maturation RNase YbeY [candidate division WOR-1 bacterium RIFOXYA12_FULL_36_13]
MVRIFLNFTDKIFESDKAFRGINLKVGKILSEHKARGGMGITFGDGALLRELNKKYRNKNKTTDVLSFNLGDKKNIMGDVYISVPAAKRQAKEYNISLKEELLRLAIHGTLHVLGYTHKEMGV